MLPRLFKEAMTGPQAAFWKGGIERELASQSKNSTWTLVPSSSAANILTSLCVFTTKLLPSAGERMTGIAEARLVARGFQQIEGVDYNETFAPVIKFGTLRLLLALVAYFDLEPHQMDVATAFLNGEPDEDIYME